MSAEELLADTSAMLEWLGEKQPFDVVGYAGESYGCPVARFLTERLHLPPESVGVACTAIYVAPYARSPVFPMPQWIPAFIVRIDARGCSWPITASEAYDILASEVPS